MYIIIDNFDSFTYNIYQYFTEICDCEIEVHRNDSISIDRIKELYGDRKAHEGQ